jgi:hypothetical protein
MGRPQEDIKTSRIYISPSVELAGYLNELARIGIHGKTKSEVANALISREIERLVKEENPGIEGLDSDGVRSLQMPCLKSLQ